MRWVVIAFCLGIIVSVVAGLPASVLVPDQLQSQVKAQGSPFNGRASFEQPLPMKVSWDLDFLPLLWLQLGGQVTAVGEGIKGNGSLAYHFGEVTVSNAVIQVEPSVLVRKMADPPQVSSNSIQVNVAQARLFPNKQRIEYVEGTIDWQGGAVQMKGLDGVPLQLVIPPLIGDLSTIDEGIELVVREVQGPQVGRFVLTYDGLIKEEVLKHVQSWANLSYEGVGDEVLFRRQRPLVGSF